MNGLALSVSMFALTAGGDERVDLRPAVTTLLKALAYDTNFDTRGKGPLTVLVLSDPDHADSRTALFGAVKDLNLKIMKRPVKFVTAEVKDEAALQTAIDAQKVQVLLLAPTTSAPVTKAASEAMQDSQIYALALDGPTVENRFIPLGVESVGDKLKLVVNQKACAAVGARFEPAMLKLARVIE